jgi:hypothetical protein
MIWCSITSCSVQTFWNIPFRSCPGCIINIDFYMAFFISYPLSVLDDDISLRPDKEYDMNQRLSGLSLCHSPFILL